jgi:hypothetical protein
LHLPACIWMYLEAVSHSFRPYNVITCAKSEAACLCRYLNALQTTAQHLLRYLAAAVVVNKRRRNAMKDLIRVIEQEAYEYSDPITQFLECLFVRYDFEGAQVRGYGPVQQRADCHRSLLTCSFRLSSRLSTCKGITIVKGAVCVGGYRQPIC